jgi:hypothetical protein
MKYSPHVFVWTVMAVVSSLVHYDCTRSPSIVSVAVESTHACAVRSTGAVLCWGQDINHQLGTIPSTNSGKSAMTPMPVNGIDNAVAVAVEMWHTCALLADGTVRCWGMYQPFYHGDSPEGAVPLGTFITLKTPTSIPGVTTAIAIAGGPNFDCALLEDGTIQCWGQHESRLFSDLQQMQPASLSPVTITRIPTAESFAISYGAGCALLTNGTVQCWEDPFWNYTVDFPSEPTTVKEIATAVSLSMDGTHACAVLMNGTVKCWGKLDVGRHTTIPTLINGITTARMVSVGTVHTCVTLSDGRIQCWGTNNVGQLGNGTHTDTMLPVNATGISTAKIVTAGTGAGPDHYTTCAVIGDGSLWCWGHIYGQVDHGSTGDSSLPVKVGS